MPRRQVLPLAKVSRSYMTVLFCPRSVMLVGSSHTPVRMRGGVLPALSLFISNKFWVSTLQKACLFRGTTKCDALMLLVLVQGYAGWRPGRCCHKFRLSPSRRQTDHVDAPTSAKPISGFPLLAQQTEFRKADATQLGVCASCCLCMRNSY